MSITLDVNAFLNKDVCTSECDDMAMEKEMETNIFDEIEHLLKFNKNLEYEQQTKEEEQPKPKKAEEIKNQTTTAVNLDFFNTTSDDFLLTSDSQSLLGEDALLFTVEQDRLQPISSRFMVPGIYKRIEGVATSETKRLNGKPSNVFISELERHGRVVRQEDFERLYILAEDYKESCMKRVLLVESMESDDDEEIQEIEQPEVNVARDAVMNKQEAKESTKEKIPKEWDALNRLAYDILKLTNRDHIVIDRKNNEIVRTQFNTGQKTIYRFLAPEMLGLKPNTAQDSKVIDLDEEEEDNKNIAQNCKNKLGRPKKRPTEDGGVKKSNKCCKKIEKSLKSLDDNKAPVPTNPILRTRSGRLIKTPITQQEVPILPLELTLETPQESIANLLNDLKDSDYHGSKVDPVQSSYETPVETPEDIPLQSPLKRKIPPEAICPTCKKIFLGRRLQRHFTQHPDHMKVPTSDEALITNNFETPLTYSSQSTEEDMSLFKFLISKLQKSNNLNEDQKADLFLNELNDLVEQLQLRSSRLIRNTSGLHFVNQRCSKLLGIPEGQYALDLTAIEQPIDPDLHSQYENSNSQTHHHHHHHSLPNHINNRSLDYTNLSITLDDTLTDEAAQKLNLSAGGKLLPPSEESLLRAVDDLVQTDINKIHTSSMLQQQQRTLVTNTLSSSSANTSTVVDNHNLPPHIDHASDNAVEAVHMKETSANVNTPENPLLDLSVDFFQFNN